MYKYTWKSKSKQEMLRLRTHPSFSDSYRVVQRCNIEEVFRAKLHVDSARGLNENSLARVDESVRGNSPSDSLSQCSTAEIDANAVLSKGAVVHDTSSVESTSTAGEVRVCDGNRSKRSVLDAVVVCERGGAHRELAVLEGSRDVGGIE